MTRPLILATENLPPAPPPLVEVDRASAELRRGGIVLIAGEDGQWLLALAAEAADEDSLARLHALSGNGTAMVLTGRRAAAIGLGDQGNAVLVEAKDGLSAAEITGLADPCSTDLLPDLSRLTPSAAPAGGAAAAAVKLAKIARLLPAAVIAVMDGDAAAFARDNGLLTASCAPILTYEQIAASTLRPIAQARVPLADAEDTQIMAFRPSDGGTEHLAIVVGQPDLDQPVLTRLHSECFTGDLLGSLRCDCGDQLRGALAEINKAGGGILLYLSQEGRGIGLVNKLRAYRLQDQGFDTLDANLQLGFDDDERIYQPAAQMLRLLGVRAVRLLTNNPNKVQALARHDIPVAERVKHVFPANGHNESYLQTKKTRSGHLF